MIQPSAGGSALGAAPAAESHRVLRLLALLAVSLGVVVLAAAAFVLSYTGVHEVALAAGVSKTLARIYPPMFDAILVIAAAAVLSLRGAGWIVRAFAWLCLLVVLAATAGVDTLHATGTHLPHRTAAITAAIVPWALALIGFVLLLAMLRHARLRRAQSRRATSAAAVAAPPDTIPGAVSRVMGAMLPATTATDGRRVLGPDEEWPGGEFQNGRPDGDVRSHGQTTELSATGYPGDILVAGRPPVDDPDAEVPAAGEHTPDGAAADEVAAGAPALDETAADEVDADEAGRRSAPTVPAQALPTRDGPAPADTEPAGPGPASTGPATTEPADTVSATARPGPSEDDAGRSGAARTSAEAGETAAGIPLRWPGSGGADQPETAESSLDSEPGQDDPVSDEAYPASRPGVVWVPRAREEPSAEVIRDGPGQHPSPSADPGTPATTAAPEASIAPDASTFPETAGPGRAPAGPEPADTAPTEPAQTEPAQTEPAQTEPAQTEPAQTEPAQAEPGRAEPAQAEPGQVEPAQTGPGRAGDIWSTPASGSAEPEAPAAAAEPEQPSGASAPADQTAAAGTEQPGEAPAPTDQPGKPPATSFLDSVFGPRPAGADRAPGGAPADEARTQPPGAHEEQAEGHPATQPSDAPDAEPQFDRFRSSPTPPDDE